jgi:hypothetical protein
MNFRTLPDTVRKELQKPKEESKLKGFATSELVAELCKRDGVRVKLQNE